MRVRAIVFFAVAIGGALLSAAQIDPAWANKRVAQGKIPPPRGCQWASSRMYYDVDLPGADCFAFGQDGTSAYIITSVVRGNIEGEVRLGSLPFVEGGQKDWVSIREIKGLTTEVRLFPATPHQLILLHGVKVTKGKGRVDFAFREVDFRVLFGETLLHMGQYGNFATMLAQMALAKEEERRRAQASRSDRQINIDPTTDSLLKLVLPYVKETVFGCGDTDLARQQAVAGVAVNAIMKELDLDAQQRVSLTYLVTSFIAAFNKMMLFDLRDMVGDKCAR